MEQSDGETFEDFASDEVRPSVRSADRLRPADLTEGEPDIHPDYGVFRDEDATWDHEDDNPNRDQIGDNDQVLDHPARRDDSGRAQRAGNAWSGESEPPYQRMSMFAPNQDEIGSRERIDGTRDEPNLAQASEPAGRAESMMTGTRNLGDGDGQRHRPVLNSNMTESEARQPRGTNSGGGATGSSVPGERGEISLELLVNQLLQQNAMLHQELTEARLSSGSCSNVSLDGRSEGRGQDDPDLDCNVGVKG